MKLLFAVMALLLTSSAFSQVAVVNTFQPLAGKSSLVVSYMREAKAIHDTMGVTVAISSNTDGSYGYAMLAPSWEAYGQFAQSLSGNPAWAAFNAKQTAAPAAVQIGNRQLSIVSAPTGGPPGSVSEIFVWETTTGSMQDLVQGALGAEPIHEAAGASVSVYVDIVNNQMYYMQSFPNFAAWGKFRDTPIPEFAAYMQSLQNANGGTGAEIVNQFTNINVGP